MTGRISEQVFSLKTKATAQFGDLGVLGATLAPLNRELSEIFTIRGSKGTPFRDRARYMVALARIVEFFRALDFHPIVAENFLELAKALNELDSGIVRPFLRPSLAHSRPIDPEDIWIVRAFVAIAIDVINYDANAKMLHAAGEIGKHFGFIFDIVSPDTKNLPALILKWRQQFLKQTVPNAMAQQIFENRASLVAEVIADLTARGIVLTGPSVSAAIMSIASRQAMLAADADAIKRFSRRIKRKKARS